MVSPRSHLKLHRRIGTLGDSGITSSTETPGFRNSNRKKMKTYKKPSICARSACPLVCDVSQSFWPLQRVDSSWLVARGLRMLSRLCCRPALLPMTILRSLVWHERLDVQLQWCAVPSCAFQEHSRSAYFYWASKVSMQVNIWWLIIISHSPWLLYLF